MILNAHAFRCSQNCPSPVEFGRVKTHAHVGDKSAEHKYEVGGLDVLSHVFVAAHRAAVNAKVQRMFFGNRAFAQKIGGDGNVHCPVSYTHLTLPTSDLV